MHSKTVENILAELEVIQDGADRDAASLSRARSLIGHPNNDVRWQALIAVGQWIESSPEPVWRVVLEYGENKNEDMRTGVATVLLEHLLEHHFAAYFPCLRDRIEAGAPRLADTLGKCWPFGEAELRWDEVRILVDRA